MRGMIGILFAMLAAGQPRYMPPAEVGCARDQLTSFTGAVTAYSRGKSQLRISIHTDENTTEKFALRAPYRMLYQGNPFGEGDWPKVEERPGRLKPGVRATMWVCESGRKTLDWQPPPETR